MERLKSSQECMIDELSQHQQQVFQEIVKKLAEHFKSEETIKKFCEWSKDEAPAALATWRETKSEALKCISERIHQFVQQWEDDQHEFKKAQDSLIQYCTEKYDVMAEEIYKVEEQAFLNETESDVLQDKDVTQSRHRKSTAPTWLREGLASVVVGSSGALGKLLRLGARGKRKPHLLSQLERYNNSPCGYMSQRSRKCLDGFTTQDRLLPFITEQLEDAVQFLRQIKEKITQLREGDAQLYLQLLENKKSKTEIEEIYEPLKVQIRLLQYGLTIYNVSEIRTSDFKDEELKCDEKWESIIGEGSFSTVYKGVLSREGQPKIKVALKRYREPLTTNNAWHFADEERALR